MNAVNKFVHEKIVISKIHFIRGENVLIDEDLAELYEVKTKRLNEQVKRNIERFPDDFMFQLSKEEFDNLKSQFATSSWGGRRTPPFVFTEHGVLMLSSVLKSKKSIKVNIQIMRVFTKMRALLLNHKDLLLKVEKIESKMEGQSHEIKVLFEYIKKLASVDKQKATLKSRKRIGYKINKD